MKKAVLFVTIYLLATTVTADDLYKVTLQNYGHAEILKSAEVDVLLRADGAYLVLAEKAESQALMQAGLDIKLLASDVRRDQLALDNRWDRKNAERFTVLYESAGVRLLSVEERARAGLKENDDLVPVGLQPFEVRYYPNLETPALSYSADDLLDSLLDELSYDSLYSYVCALQTYPYRAYDSASNDRARDWILDKFDEFGYYGVGLDPFFYNDHECHNVIASKPGTVYPEKQVIVGAHYDSDWDSPGADDNASGVAGVLELARLFSGLDLPMTLIFCAFDAEEKGKIGAYHYVDEAVANDDEIIFMQNMDMIGAEGNDAYATLYYGPEQGYAILWDQLAYNYGGISGVFAGTSTRSDHYPFQQAGFDVCFCIEYEFSTVYHTLRDSTTYMDFDYMTRMVKANLATVYTVAVSPPPLEIIAIKDPNDGHSLVPYWPRLDPAHVDFYRLSYFRSADPGNVFYHDVPGYDTSCVVDGLTAGEEYGFYVRAYDFEGRTAVVSDPAYATPSTQLDQPWNLVALPLPGAIRISWMYDRNDLSFDFCRLIRDGAVVAELADTIFIDDLSDADLHRYHVVAVDLYATETDTLGLQPALMKAATLAEDRILAVNRSTGDPLDMVDEIETGSFLREALSGYNYDYLSDTASTTDPADTSHLDLFDMVDYGLVVIGAESASEDDIGTTPSLGGLLDSLTHYLSIGGKVLIFGRWGHIWDYLQPNHYEHNGLQYDDAYYGTFHIDCRWQTPTLRPSYSGVVYADLIGAHSLNFDYPDLIWDSVATAAHADDCYLTVTGVTGIPSVSFVDLLPSPVEILYTYHSRDEAYTWEGQPVAWRYLAPDYQYIYFDIPLSFFERSTAIDALRQAVDDLLEYHVDVEEPLAEEILPASLMLSQNYPNPFNPNTKIVFSLPEKRSVTLSIYNVMGQHVATLAEGEMSAGAHVIEWDGTDDNGKPLATGLYLYRLRAGSVTESKKMLLLK